MGNGIMKTLTIFLTLLISACNIDSELTDPVMDKNREITKNLSEGFPVSMRHMDAIPFVFVFPDNSECHCDFLIKENHSVILDCQYVYENEYGSSCDMLSDSKTKYSVIDNSIIVEMDTIYFD